MMDYALSFFNKKSIMIGCVVGAAVGLSYYGYKQWSSSNAGEKENGADHNGAQQNGAGQSGVGQDGAGPSCENEGEDGAVKDGDSDADQSAAKPAFGGLKRGFLL